MNNSQLNFVTGGIIPLRMLGQGWAKSHIHCNWLLQLSQCLIEINISGMTYYHHSFEKYIDIRPSVCIVQWRKERPHCAEQGRGVWVKLRLQLSFSKLSHIQTTIWLPLRWKISFSKYSHIQTTIWVPPLRYQQNCTFCSNIQKHTFSILPAYSLKSFNLLNCRGAGGVKRGGDANIIGGRFFSRGANRQRY